MAIKKSRFLKEESQPKSEAAAAVNESKSEAPLLDTVTYMSLVKSGDLYEVVKLKVVGDEVVSKTVTFSSKSKPHAQEQLKISMMKTFVLGN